MGMAAARPLRHARQRVRSGSRTAGTRATRARLPTPAPGSTRMAAIAAAGCWVLRGGSLFRASPPKALRNGRYGMGNGAGGRDDDTEATVGQQASAAGSASRRKHELV
jgi:hypothetical protein